MCVFGTKNGQFFNFLSVSVCVCVYSRVLQREPYDCASYTVRTVNSAIQSANSLNSI